MVREGDDQQTYNHTLLGTVMSNLLRNALHYTEHGQVRLVLSSTAASASKTPAWGFR